MRGLYGGYYHPVSPCPSFSPRVSVPADKSVFFMYLPVIESVIITTFPVFESVTIPSVITSALLLTRTRFDCPPARQDFQRCRLLGQFEEGGADFKGHVEHFLLSCGDDD